MAYGLTVRDTIDHLRDWSGGNAGTNSEANIRRAIQLGMLDLSEPRSWVSFSKLHRVFLQAPYSTGTITYDHTGGSSERLLTLASGTFPADMITDATGWDVVVGNVVSRVSKYLSTTTVQLDSTLNFGADIAAGTSYQVLKSRYLLPADFRCLDDGVAENLWYARYVQPYEWLFQHNVVSSAGPPSVWTITGDDLNRYRMMMLVSPAPAEAETLDMWYQRKPRDLIFSGYNAREYAGTVSVSSTTVTGTGTSFSSGMVGSIIRFGTTNSQVPDGRLGVNPYSSERIITAYTSTTSITIDSAPDVAVSGMKYVVSDPIDIDPSMEAAFMRGCEYQLAVIKKASSAEQDRTLSAYMMAKDSAYGSDRKVYALRYAGDGGSSVGRALGNMGYTSTVVD